jgi:hypothetical protein
LVMAGFHRVRSLVFGFGLNFRTEGNH